MAQLKGRVFVPVPIVIWSGHSEFLLRLYAKPGKPPPATSHRQRLVFPGRLLKEGRQLWKPPGRTLACCSYPGCSSPPGSLRHTPPDTFRSHGHRALQRDNHTCFRTQPHNDSHRILKSIRTKQGERQALSPGLKPPGDGLQEQRRSKGM